MLLHLKKHTISAKYPYNVVDFDQLNLDAPVVFFTGENGSGKSTLLRVIAQLTNSFSVSKNIADGFVGYDGFSVAWRTRLKRGYYFQSEDFYSFLEWVSHEAHGNREMLDDSRARHQGHRSMGKIIEIGMHQDNVLKMERMVTEFKEASHGEGYIRYFATKLRGKTLYLLDEPEAPLSFQNQLALLSLIKQCVDEGSQFIMCTHSPILLAYPGALIHHFGAEIETLAYEDHPLVRDYDLFLRNPQRYMRYLFEDRED